jgi:hypothetical protein
MMKGNAGRNAEPTDAGREVIVEIPFTSMESYGEIGIILA